MPSRRTPLADRFAKFVGELRHDGCMLWTGSVDPKTGYGKIASGGKEGMPVGAHRVAYELAHGPIPAAKLVLHKCDVRACVNPAHLFLGDHTSNAEDMVRKGRQSKGEDRPLSKLSAARVRRIRQTIAAGKCSQRALAKRERVSRQTIGRVVRREGWRHVD